MTASQPPEGARPIEARRNQEENALALRWSSGESISLPGELLRRRCPCASCEELRGSTSHAKPLTGRAGLLKVVTATKDESVRIDEIWAVGSYALGIRFGDKHDTGIFSYALLRELTGETLVGLKQEDDHGSLRT